MKNYVKYNETTYEITEFAPYQKDGVVNYNNASNEERLIEDGYSLQDISTAYDGKQYITEHLPEKPLELAKSEKIEELKVARDNAEQSGFPYLDKTFQSDEVSCIRLTMAAQTAGFSISANQPYSINWTTADNSIITMDANQMLGAIVALATWSNTLHQYCNGKKEEVELATTVEAVEAVVFNINEITSSISL